MTVTMIGLTGFSFLLFSGIAQAVVLPGKCPAVPLSHDQEEHEPHIYQLYGMFKTLFLGVPFSDVKSSYLFHEVNINTFSSPSYVTTEKDFLKIISDKLLCEVRFKLDEDRVNVVLEIRIPLKENRIKTLHETGKMWVDDGFMIFWGCKEEKNGKQHDEALLVLEVVVPTNDGKEIEKNTEWYLKRLGELNGTIRRYLKDPFLNTINWTPELRNATAESFFSTTNLLSL